MGGEMKKKMVDSVYKKTSSSPNVSRSSCMGVVSSSSEEPLLWIGFTGLMSS